MAAGAAAAQGGEDGGANGFSSLMDIGAAYGIWNPDLDEFKKKQANANNVNAGDKITDNEKEDGKEKLVIDEEEEEEEEPLSPGGPEEPMESAPSSAPTSTGTSKAATAAMETSA